MATRRNGWLMGFGAAAGVVTCVGVACGEVGIGTLEIEGPMLERPDPFAWLMQEEAEPTLSEVVEILRDAGQRDDLGGVLIRLKDAQLNRAQIEEIGQAMRGVREAGKKVHVFAEGYGAIELLIGAHADEVVMQQGGVVMLPGLYMEEMYLAGTLEWMGLEADFVQVGDYKGASEALERTGPSEAWEENISGLLDGLYERMRVTLKEGRDLSDRELDEAMETAWLARGEDAIEVGLIDVELDLPDLEGHLEEGYGDEVRLRSLKGKGRKRMGADMSNPFAFMKVFEEMFAEPRYEPTRPTVAVVHIDGAIVDGDSKRSPMSGQESVGSRTIRKELSKIEREPLIRAVVLRIDSPGGSAVASEVIWQGIRRVAEKKPVFVSIGNMAASGGYYVAVAGDRIYVDPSSIVGSIGVVGGKISLGGLYEKLHVNTVGRARGPRAEMFRSDRVWDAEQLAFVRSKMEQTYELFTQRVEQGREKIDLDETAEGRLFVGQRVVELEMADEVGSLADAIEDVALEVGLDERGRYDVMHYPGPKGLDALIEEMFGGFAGARGPKSEMLGVAGVLREVVGEGNWAAVGQAVDAVVQLRDEPVLLTMPSVLIVE